MQLISVNRTPSLQQLKVNDHPVDIYVRVQRPAPSTFGRVSCSEVNPACHLDAPQALRRTLKQVMPFADLPNRR